MEGRPRRRASARGFTAALQRFLHTETSSGVLILGAAVVALLWANAAGGSYERFWHTKVAASAGGVTLPGDLRHWINDGAMTLFFFVVGLEIKRELVVGELRDRRAASLPVAGALGGMIVPALLYAAVTAGSGGTRGWGIPMATDIAFAVGLLALVARALPSGLRLFLLTLAIVDDIGAILVIAVFYTERIDGPALGIAALALLVIAVVIRARGVPALVAVPIGVVVWLAVLASGVHATIAGVVLAFVMPAARDGDPEASPLARAERALHPVTSFIVVPLFALANAGVTMSADALGDQGARRIALGVVVGLVAGKLAGIAAGAFLAVRAGVARLPDGVTWRQVAGVAAVGGIGFTVSLFIADLAFADRRSLDAAKLGILAGSLMAGAIGAAILARARAARA